MVKFFDNISFKQRGYDDSKGLIDMCEEPFSLIKYKLGKE